MIRYSSRSNPLTMDRDLNRFTEQRFDLAVVGGGILGSFIARQAATRGLKVGLVEKNDFASGTTSGSGKVLHGGIRPLRKLHLTRALRARREQQALAAEVPGLVRSLPFFVPCRRDRLTERLILRAGSGLWHIFEQLTHDTVALPPARFVSDTRDLGLSKPLARSFSGGLLFHDLQLRSPERLTVEALIDAARKGAAVLNYAECVDLLTRGERVAGLQVRDTVEGREVEVEAKAVVNATGAWAPQITRTFSVDFPDMALAKGIHVVLDRDEPPAALALPYRVGESEEFGTSGERRLFVIPWEGRTLIGASYRPFSATPDRGILPDPAEVHRFLAEFDRQWPALELSSARILYSYSGLYPVFGRQAIAGGTYAASEKPLIVEHSQSGGPRGLVSAVPVKFTTARKLAREVLATVLESSSIDVRPSTKPPNATGKGSNLSSDAIIDWGPGSCFADPEALAEVASRAARHEMALDLSDVLFRRSWIGHLGHPGRDRLQQAAEAMAEVLGWSAEEQAQQVRSVRDLYRSRGAHLDAAGNTEHEPSASVEQYTGQELIGEEH